MSSRICCGTLGRPGFPRRIFHHQNNWKPLRCQATTVSGFTIISTDSTQPTRVAATPKRFDRRVLAATVSALTPHNRELLSQCQVFEPQLGRAFEYRGDDAGGAE